MPNYLDWICDDSDMKMNSASVDSSILNDRRSIISL